MRDLNGNVIGGGRSTVVGGECTSSDFRICLAAPSSRASRAPARRPASAIWDTRHVEQEAALAAAEATSARFRDAGERLDLDAFLETLAPDVRLRSPISFLARFDGFDDVAEVLRVVFELLEDIEYFEDLGDATTRAFFYRGRVNRQPLEGAILARLDDGAQCCRDDDVLSAAAWADCPHRSAHASACGSARAGARSPSRCDDSARGFPHRSGGRAGGLARPGTTPVTLLSVTATSGSPRRTRLPRRRAPRGSPAAA